LNERLKVRKAPDKEQPESNSGLLDLEMTFEQLQDVGFWVSPSLLERLLRDD
jgi:hypothetical protein